MTTLTIDLPEELCEQLKKVAAERGMTVDALMEELLTEYLEVVKEMQL